MLFRSHVTTVKRLDTDNAHQHLGGDTKASFGTRQGLSMFLPERHAGFDASRFDEAITVGSPIFSLPGGRRLHQAGDVLNLMSLSQLLTHPRCGQRMLSGQLIGQLQQGAGLAAAREHLAPLSPDQQAQAEQALAKIAAED